MYVYMPTYSNIYIIFDACICTFQVFDFMLFVIFDLSLFLAGDNPRSIGCPDKLKMNCL